MKIRRSIVGEGCLARILAGGGDVGVKQQQPGLPGRRQEGGLVSEVLLAAQLAPHHRGAVNRVPVHPAHYEYPKGRGT